MSPLSLGWYWQNVIIIIIICAPTGLWTLDSVRQHWLSILRSARQQLVLVLAAKPDNPHLEMSMMMAMSTFVICTHPIPFSLIPSAKPLVFSLLYYSYKTLAAGLCTNSPPRIIFSLTADTRLGDKSVFNNKLIWHRVFPSPHNSTSLYLYLDILSLLFLTKPAWKAWGCESCLISHVLTLLVSAYLTLLAFA